MAVDFAHGKRERHLPGMFRDANFQGVKETGRFMTPSDTLVLIHTRKNDGGAG